MVARDRNSTFLILTVLVVVLTFSAIGQAQEVAPELLVKLPVESMAAHHTSVIGRRIARRRAGFTVIQSRLSVSEASFDNLIEECGEITARYPGAICEPNVRFKTTATPNDTYWPYQWNLRLIGAQAGWDFSHDASQSMVAVIDTGVDYSHFELKANMAVNAGEIAGNKIDDDKNGFVDDVYGYDFVGSDGDPLDEHGHGTHVAGIIGAQGNDSSGMVGVAWSAQVLGVRVLDADGSGTLGDVIAGVRYAVQRGAKVINLSLGAAYGSKLLLEALQEAEQAGVVIVAAAGNAASDNDVTPTFPANYQLSTLISVAATDRNDELASFSNVGVHSVHIAAPGVSILSTFLFDSHVFMSGTSMAAPHVAGAAALVRARNTLLTGAQVKDVILNSATVMPHLSSKVATSGRLNLAAALTMAASGSAPGDSTEEEQGDVAIDLSQRGKGARVQFSASVYSLSSGQEIAGLSVDLQCGGTLRGTGITNAEGRVVFKLARGSRDVTCRAVAQETFSNHLRLKGKSKQSGSKTK